MICLTQQMPLPLQCLYEKKSFYSDIVRVGIQVRLS